MRAVVVDDETRARENLIMLLSAIESKIEVVAQASNIKEAKKHIDNLQPDIVFLDIQMPNGNGFDLLKKIKFNNFQLVFVTAYDDYAIKAFEVSAVDYLLKPIDIERLEQTLEKLSDNIGQENKLKTLENNLKENKFNQMSIPSINGYDIISIDDLIYLKAEEAYTALFVNKNNEIKKYLYAKHLNYFENLFENEKHFFRSHRSWMVNLNYLKFYNKSTNELTICDFKIPLSRRRVKLFDSIINN